MGGDDDLASREGAPVWESINRADTDVVPVSGIG